MKKTKYPNLSQIRNWCIVLKYNLKNRPKWDREDKRLAIGQYLTVLKEVTNDLETWFEGFEKELREMLANDDMSPLIRIKEILGE